MKNAQDLDFLSNPIGNNRVLAKIQRPTVSVPVMPG